MSHWHLKRVNEAFAPSQERGCRPGWLASSGFQGDRVKLSKNQAWIEVDGISIGDVERLLNTEYHVYEHEDGDEHIGEIWTNAARRPTSAGANQLPTSISAKSQTGCDVAVTPDCLRSLYNMTYTPRATDRNSFGILNRASNGYLQSDLDMFFRNFSPSLVGKAPVFVSMMAVQMIQAKYQILPVSLLQVGGPQTGDFISFNEWLDAIPNPSQGAQTHDVGLSFAERGLTIERAPRVNLSPFYTQRQCNEFGKLGTVDGYCLDDNGSMNLNGTHFKPGWPASCPWVTAVGGTQVRANASTTQSGAEEQPIPHGGVPAKAVDTYLQQLKKTDPGLFKQFNSKGASRVAYISEDVNMDVTACIPRLECERNMFVSIDNGSVSISSGTSGATPTIGAIITLVNDARIAAGKKPVGFINPTIYSPGFIGAFNDIRSGTNQGCKGLQGDRKGGFTAGPGWDPASGVQVPLQATRSKSDQVFAQG
ncbi:peptidase S8/S53 domain-containing protein [Infundibulicybe gibba]|nr:peptidase S8/S53 domain-containing protein [Infundibulicybe gibba]